MTLENENSPSHFEPELNDQTICAFVDELFRLAEDTKIHITESIRTPRLLSNMAAMRPIVSFLSNQGLSSIVKKYSINDLTKDDVKPNPIGFSPSQNSMTSEDLIQDEGQDSQNGG